MSSWTSTQSCASAIVLLHFFQMVDHAEAAKQSMTLRRVGGATLLGFQRSRWVSGHRQTIWRCYDCHRDLHYRVSISKLGTRGHRSMAVIHAPSSRLKRRSLHSRRCSAGRAAIYCRRSHRLRSAAVAPRRGKSTSVEVGEAGPSAGHHTRWM